MGRFAKVILHKVRCKKQGIVDAKIKISQYNQLKLKSLRNYNFVSQKSAYALCPANL